MVRPVWHFPRHNEADTSEALQSDVMRFIAILALCLVAIFALVRSLPPRPVAKPDAPRPAVETPPPPAREAVSVSAPMPVRPFVREEQPDPEPLAPPAQPRRPVVRVPEISRETAQPAPRRAETPVKASTSAAQQGLMLRFASDTALLALVAQRRVGVYAWVRDAALRLSSERGVLSFASATAPKHFHSMTPDTVPSAIARALDNAAPTVRAAGTVTWGVTLPVETKRQLERLVRQHQSGTLVIETNGRVRFQKAGQN